MSEKRIIEGLTEAVAIAKGERPAARIHVNGYAYIPEALEFRPPIPDDVWSEMVERGKKAVMALDALCSTGRCSYPIDCMCEANAEACLRAAFGIDRAAADAVYEPEER